MQPRILCRTVALFGLLGAIMLAAGAARADPPTPAANPLAGATVAGSVARKISYQGRLTDSDGNPVNGSANLVFQLWDDATAGGQVGTDIVRNGVPVQGGLFIVDLDVPPGAATGQALWLRIGINGQWLAPRQELLPVPYALSLRPGAVIAGNSSDPALSLGNAGGGAAMHAAGNILGVEASGVVTGVVGTASATNGRGVAGIADNYGGVGVAGHATFGIGVRGEGEIGLSGIGATGVGVQGRSAGVGVLGASTLSNGVLGTTDGGYDTAGVRGTASDKGFGGYFSSARGPGLAAFGAEGIHGGDTSSSGYGVHGVSGNIGVQGDGGAVGVVGQSTDGLGVSGWSSNSTGVLGQTAGSGANGVSGVNTSGGLGVRGESSSGGGTGVWGTGGGFGVYGQTTGTAGIRGYYPANGNFADLGTGSYGVHAVAFNQDGIGVLAQSVTGDAVRSETSADGRAAVFAKNRGAGRGIEAEAETVAVLATSIHGSGSDQAALRAVNLNASHGMAGKLVNASDYHTAHFENDGSGGILFLRNHGDDAGNGGGDFITALSGSGAVQFRVLSSGEVRSAVGFHTPAQDFAELLPGGPGLEAGDVLVIGDNGALTRSTAPYASSVAGVYSTQPGFVGGQTVDSRSSSDVPLAVVGVAPVKASTENGAIHPGDLLVTSATPGRAMRADPNPPIGTVIGKALERLDQGRGTIKMLATLQ